MSLSNSRLDIPMIPQNQLGAFFQSRLAVLRLQDGQVLDFNPIIAKHFLEHYSGQVQCGCFNRVGVLGFSAWAPQYFGALAQQGCGYYLIMRRQAVAFHPGISRAMNDEEGWFVLGSIVASLLTKDVTPFALIAGGVGTKHQIEIAKEVVPLFEKVFQSFASPIDETPYSDTSKPPGKQDPYKILGINPSASPAEVKKAYLEQLSLNHPDKANHLSKEIQQLADKQTRAIKEAYEMIERGRYTKK